MAFTAKLGTRNSRPGNLEPGISEPVNRSIHLPETILGPPMRGSPFLQRISPGEAASLRQGPYVAPRVGSETYPPEITRGPPLRGAPWFKGFTTPPTPPSKPGPAPPNLIANKGFVPRVPSIEGPASDNRRRRHTEIVSEIFNSLIGSGQLVQTGPASWLIQGGAGGVISFDGRTGAVVLLASDILVALGYMPVPPTRSVFAGGGLAGGGNLSTDITIALMPIGAGGTFTNATITIDSYGRVVAASSGGPFAITSPDNSLTITAGTQAVINLGHTNIWTAQQEFQGKVKVDLGGSPGILLGEVSPSGIGAGAVDIQSQRRIASQRATGALSIAIGSNSTASGVYDIAIGTAGPSDGASASGGYSVAIGPGASAAVAGVAIGPGATATSLAGIGSAVAIGSGASSAKEGVAIGDGPSVGQFGVGIGFTAQASTSGVAIGNLATSSATKAIAIGASSTASAAYAVAMAQGSTASGTYAVAISFGATASAYGSIAIGKSSSSAYANSVVIGGSATVSGYNAVAIGSNATAAQQGTAIGTTATTSGYYGTAIGYGANAALFATAIGKGALASGTNALALGVGCTAAGNYATAIGYVVSASANGATAIGSGVNNSTANTTLVGFSTSVLSISASGVITTVPYLYPDASTFVDTSKNIYIGAGLKDATPSFGTSGQILGNVAGVPTWQNLNTAKIAAIRAAADLIGQSAGVTICTFTDGGSGGSYRCGAYITITAITAGTVVLQVSWTDETSTARTISIAPQGLTSANLTATGVFLFPEVAIRVAALTAITVKTTFAGVSVAYDVGGQIEQLR